MADFSQKKGGNSRARSSSQRRRDAAAAGRPGTGAGSTELPTDGDQRRLLYQVISPGVALIAGIKVGPDVTPASPGAVGSSVGRRRQLAAAAKTKRYAADRPVF